MHKNMRTKQLLPLLLIMGGTTWIPAAKAQKMLGVSTSNWANSQSMYLNPANIADSRTKFSIDLFALDLGMETNFSSVKMSDLFGSINDEDGESQFQFGSDNKPSRLYGPVIDVRGPGATVSINDKHSVAFFTRVRFMAQVHDLDQTLFRTISGDGLSDVEKDGLKLKIDAFNVTGHGWTEYGLGYGGVIYNQDNHFLKGGLNLRLLKGAAYFSILNEHMDISYAPGTDYVSINNTSVQYASNMLGGISGVNDLTKSKGSGMGADLGLVYEYRPENNSDFSQNKYLFRVSASVIDIGSIKYTNNNAGIRFYNKTAGTPAYISGPEIESRITNVDSMIAYMEEQGFGMEDLGASGTKVSLPTALILSGDYNIWKNFYANLLFMGNLASRDKIGNSVYGRISLTPRYDTRIISVGLPLTYSMLSKSMQVGLGLRVSGFYLGSDNLFTNGTNFYFGFQVPFSKKKDKAQAEG